MTDLSPSPDDLEQARALLARDSHARQPETPGLVPLAAALQALRRAKGTGEGITDEELLAAHDALHAAGSSVRHEGTLGALALALVERGVVPASEDYEGLWYFWWPKKAHGPCRDCRKQRALTRYSGFYGDEYRYLCARCRREEREGNAREAARLREAPAAARDTAPAAPAPPSDDQWSTYATELHEMLAPLEWAGWALPEGWDSEWDATVGPLLFETVWRGDAALNVEYRPGEQVLELQPWEDVTGDFPESFTVLGETVRLQAADTPEAAQARLAERAGELGLLDATRARPADTLPEELQQDFAARRLGRLFEPAADYRQLPLEKVLKEAIQHPWLSAYLNWVVSISGRHVQPDVVPDAAAVGVAAWCWRNDTAVEEHHLATDVLMARVNIAVTQAIQPHINPVEGVDWDAIEQALTDPQWALPDGTTIASLFGISWPHVRTTVVAQLAKWRRAEDELLGPETTLALLTIGGSTDYTHSWWGQGRWQAICRRIVDDALHSQITLPQPYNYQGPEALVRDLARPDLLSDEVLRWLIDMPEGGTGGPRGLRFHPITSPPVHVWAPYGWEPDIDAAS
ncbi:hypothetical protein [Streptomyces paromomycinus]|uniref:Uncharacterized protein n=1 Tax=Streptomyces paromomycinus TaxID=92743 RepID=A0A401VTG8_STREY|nr:hypothetical protein [Streptomyces paromomycinus]GCD40366.1 hypothetical protein GKJPGBOP_00015 [Streptomyces paromomycinus]